MKVPPRNLKRLTLLKRINKRPAMQPYNGYGAYDDPEDNDNEDEEHEVRF